MPVTPFSGGKDVRDHQEQRLSRSTCIGCVLYSKGASKARCLGMAIDSLFSFWVIVIYYKAFQKRVDWGKEFWQLLVSIFNCLQFISPKCNPHECHTHWHILPQSVPIIILSFQSWALARSPEVGMRVSKPSQQIQEWWSIVTCPNMTVVPINKSPGVSSALRSFPSFYYTSSLELRTSGPEWREEFKSLTLFGAFWCQPRHLGCDLSTLFLASGLDQCSMMSGFALVLTAFSFCWSSEFSFYLTLLPAR